MNYLELINQFWAKDMEYHFSDRETALYFYLLNVCNSARWRNPFGLSGSVTMAKFGWGKTSFERARTRLKDAGLIDFRPGIGRGNIHQYLIRKKPEENLSEKELPETTLFNQSSEKVREKGYQTDPFSEKVHEKGYQTTPFFEHFYSPKAAKTELFQKPLNNKHKYKLISNKRLYISNPENNEKIILENKNQVLENLKIEKEKNSAQKEKDVLELYGTVCGSFPKIMQLTGQRKEKILRRLSEMGGLENLERVFRKMEASDFLKGNNKAGWKATFDWVFKNPDNWIKILEGNYDNHMVQPANDARFMGQLQTDLSKF